MDGPGVPEETHLTTRMQHLVGPLAGRYVGLSVSVFTGEVEAASGWGRTRQGGRIPDQRTSFQIGSITKVFTALLLADAVERGEVALDQRLDTLLPGVASHRAGPIRLVDLATHTAGLPRLPPGLWRQALRNRANPYAQLTAEQLRAAVSRRPRRAPGRRPRYSNFGPGVLGQALEVACGQPYGRLVTTRVTGPLGMQDTDIVLPSGAAAAEGHNRRGQPVPDWDLAALAGAGALRSTTADLLRLLRAHVQPETTPLEAAVRAVREPRHRLRGPLRMALGWHVLERKDGTPWWWHNGGTGGFFSFVGFDPVAVVGVAVLANSARSVDRVGMALLNELSPAGAG